MQRPFHGGCNGGGMIRTVQRVMRAGVGGAPTEPLSAAASSASNDSRKSHNLTTTTPNTPLAFSSSSTNVRERFPSAINNISNDWECVEVTSFHGNNDNDGFVGEDYHLFGTVPSRDEVANAVSALQQFLDASSSSSCSPKRNLSEHIGVDEAVGSTERTSSTDKYAEIEDWIEPSLNLFVPRTVQPRGSTERVYDALHLLQNEPSVQRMVVSLSSDKAVWAAVLDNEVVKELRSSITQDGLALEDEGSHIGSSGDEDSNPIKNIFGSILTNAKARVMQLIDKITKLVNEILQAPREEEDQDTNAQSPFTDKLKVSLMLSIVVLLLVIVARARSA